MNKNNSNNAYTLIAAALAATVTVAASSGPHDLSDTAVGIVIGFLIYPLLRTQKTDYWRKAVSVVAGLVVLLIFGVLVDLTFGKTQYHLSHFLLWLSGTLCIYFLAPVVEKKGSN